MKLKKIIAGTIASSLLFTTLAATPVSLSAAGFTENFEDGIGGWKARGDNEIVELAEPGHASDNCIKVSGRTEIWNGACAYKEEIAAGASYKISAWVMYDNPSFWQQKFELCLQYKQDDVESYPTISVGTLSSGNWTKIEGEITVPVNATDIAVYVQTAYTSNPTDSDLMDFYVDDVTCSDLGTPEIQSDLVSLKKAYADYFKFGTAMMGSECGIKPVSDLIDKHFNSLTFGNELKPDFVLDQTASLAYLEENGDQTNPQISLKKADSLLKYCGDNGIPVRGHTLVWHSQTPDWFFKENYDANGAWVSKEVMIKRMENYIKNVMETLAKDYPNVNFYAWDVVNEAFTDGGQPRSAGSNNVSNGSSAWVQVFGDNSFIEYAFTFARKYAPEGCKLFYNDYNEYIDGKTNAMINLVKDFKEKGIIDGIGMQSHLDMSYPSLDIYENALRKFAALGVEVQVTELDITTNDTSENGFKAQAKFYQDLFNLYKEVDKETNAITAIVLWGMIDSNSWRSDRAPLIFDKSYQAKPAYYSIVDGMEEVPDKTIYGDVNCDGLVTGADLIPFMGNFLGKKLTGQALLNADVLYDGEVDLRDLSTLKQFCVGDKIVLGPSRK